MKIFNWIQSKINGKQESKPVAVAHDTNKLHEACKEEFSDWPNELLAIGTFGNSKTPKEAGNLNQAEVDLTAAEVGQLHKELKHLCPEKILPECLEDEQQVIENSASKFKRCNSIVRGKGQDQAQLENTNSTGISNKSLSYLLKKTFLCSGGFKSPPPLHPLRDPITHSKFDKSRMEKILRTILHKKIYPQATSPRGNTTRKRYIDNRCESDSEDGSKWDKSDSDYIVLEI